MLPPTCLLWLCQAPERLILDVPNVGGARRPLVYVQQSGHSGGKGVPGVTGREVQGSQPVQVRSEETPGSSVAGFPASVERPASKWNDDHPLGVRNRPARRAVRRLRVGFTAAPASPLILTASFAATWCNAWCVSQHCRLAVIVAGAGCGSHASQVAADAAGLSVVKPA
jgi:hypothetical protein